LLPAVAVVGTEVSAALAVAADYWLVHLHLQVDHHIQLQLEQAEPVVVVQLTVLIHQLRDLVLEH